MTMQEAFALAAQGVKVTHEYFSEKEYLVIENGVIIFEDGVESLPREFMQIRKDNKTWQEGWSIFEAPPMPVFKKRTPPIPKQYLEVTFIGEDDEAKTRVYLADFYHVAVKFANTLRIWATIKAVNGGSSWRIDV